METGKVQPGEEEINLIDHLIVLLKWKKLIVGIPLSCVVITAITALLLPKTYRAETRIMPPQQNSTGFASQLLSQAGGTLTGLSGILGGNSQNDLYAGMLQSRTVLDNIITKFDLRERYRNSTFTDARKNLARRLTVTLDPKSNIILVAVDDREPQRAAEMANAFVEELRMMTKGLAVSEAAQRRLFFEEKLKDAKEGLIGAEERVKLFQEKTGALQVDEQVKAVIKNIAQLRAEIAAREVEFKVLKTYSKPSNPDVQKAEAALSGMKAELAKLESRKGSGNDPLMPTGRMPSVGTEYIRTLRDLKFNETLYELLLKQYEVAKLDEAREAVVIQVIDRAVPPEKKIKPKVTAMVVLAGLVSFLFSVAAAYFLEQKEEIVSNPANRERIDKLKTMCRHRQTAA